MAFRDNFMIIISLQMIIGCSRLIPVTAQNSCNDSDTIRLVNVDGSASVYKGRVELCIDNHWREACGDQWRQLEADIACIQLLGRGSYANSNNLSEGTGDVSEVLNCSLQNHESSLNKCRTSIKCQSSKSPEIVCSLLSSMRNTISMTSTGDFSQRTTTTNPMQASASILLPSPGAPVNMTGNTISITNTGDFSQRTTTTTPMQASASILLPSPGAPVMTDHNSILVTGTSTQLLPESSSPSLGLNDTKNTKGNGYPPEAIVFLTVGLLLTAASTTAISIMSVILVMKRKTKQLAACFNHQSQQSVGVNTSHAIHRSTNNNPEDRVEGNLKYDNPMYEGAESAVGEYEVAKENLGYLSLFESAKFDDEIYSKCT